MVNKEKGLLFHWKYKDFEPVRAFLATNLAIATLALVYILFPLPYSKAGKRVKAERADSLLVNHNNTLKYIPKNRINELILDSDFLHKDVFELENKAIQHAEKKALESLQSVAQDDVDTPNSYDIKYNVVPYEAPLLSDHKNLKPHTRIPHATTPGRHHSLAPQTSLSYNYNSLGAPLSKQSSNIISLGQGHDSINYEVEVSKSGIVNYAMSMDHNFENILLERYLKSLLFKPTSSTRRDQINIREIIEQID